MKTRLYPNIKWLTTLFCVSLLSVTLLTLILRLTLLRDMALVAMPTMQSTVAAGASDRAFTYQINNKVYFSSADARGDFLITNPESNTTYMQVDIIRNDTRKSVYFSGFITPGQSIQSGSLQGAALEQGVYECTAIISAFDAQTRTKLGSEEQQVSIYVGVKP